MRRRSTLPLVSLLLLAPCIAQLSAQGQKPVPDSALTTAEGTVRLLYQLVSFAPGDSTDWARVRSLFLPQAVVFMRTSRTESTVFPLDGFIADFVAFDTLAVVRRGGFTETVVRLRSTVFRDIAHVLVLYEAVAPAMNRPPQQGVDSFQLMRKDGRWWIVSITNDIVSPETPVPPELRP